MNGGNFQIFKYKNKPVNYLRQPDLNDVEILNYTDYSGIVIRKEKSKISLIKNHNVFISKSSAPEGWVELLTKINKEMERKNI